MLLEWLMFDLFINFCQIVIIFMTGDSYKNSINNKRNKHIIIKYINTNDFFQ